MKQKYTAKEVQDALAQCLDFITTPEVDRLGQWTQMPVIKGVADGHDKDSFLFYLDDKAFDRRFKKPKLKPKAFFDFAIIEAGCNGLLYPNHKFTLAYNIRRDVVYSPFVKKTQQSKYYVEYYLIHTPTFQRITL